jgi:RNA polymerase sigma factor (sigma-70 family)
MPSPTTVLLRTQSDERLVALARSGHERAFEAIVERYRRPLLRACRRVLPDARAEDAVQQALVAAWNGLVRGDQVRELRPWLYRIAHNTALNQLRVAGYDYDELHGLLAAGPAPEEELERREVARRTLSGLAALPERQRDALLAIAVQGRGQDEVALAMGISEPAVRQLVHRARTQLRGAATALTPWPVAGWLAGGGRLADLAAGGGSAGVAATVAKLGAVAVIAGGAAVGGPSVVDRLSHGARSHAPAATGAERLGREVADAAVPPAAVTAPADYTPPAPSASPSHHVTRTQHRSATDDHRRSSRGGDDDGTSGTGGPSRGSDDTFDGTRSGGGGSSESTEGSSGSHEHEGSSGSGSSGSGSGSGSGPGPSGSDDGVASPTDGSPSSHEGSPEPSGSGSPDSDPGSPSPTPSPTPGSDDGAFTSNSGSTDSHGGSSGPSGGTGETSGH